MGEASPQRGLNKWAETTDAHYFLRQAELSEDYTDGNG